MKKLKTLFKILAILPVILLYIACNPIENDTQSASMLIVENLMGTDMEGNEGNFLQSDVIFQDPEDPEKTAIYADSAVVTFRGRLLDPNSLTGPSYYNDITVTRYIVSYIRADGRNTEGVDVPYSFEGNLSFVVPIDSAKDATFVIVREVSKLEPPLIGLHEWRDAGVIEATAKVDFYGQDQVGNTIKATGYLTIFFANYANESSGS
ncbi:MAG: hypothetical protein KAT01_01630 [Candidatus Aminicenantes bacterium]|nr:hypothetical protein [Candidatus Aminicenantes bacterium]